MYEDTDAQVQSEMAALTLNVQLGDADAIQGQEQKLRATMEDRQRTDVDITYAIEECHQLAGGQS